MKQSLLFTKTFKETPADETSLNAQLLIKAGFIYKELSGVYAYLPLGLRVLNKISNIIREEMDAIGGQEIHLSALQNPEPWQKSGRWDDAVLDVWFKTRLKSGSELGLATTHEEPLTKLMKSFIRSYKDLPMYPYQLQTKFRNELRSKSGIMRTREFIMKDLYSFSKDQSDLDEFYEKAKQAYLNIFERIGIGDKTYVTFASGGSFSKYSHEFQTVCSAGEDIIYVDKAKKIAVNKEVYDDEVLSSLGLKKEEMVEEKGIEVGNIFKLGTKYSDCLDLYYTDESGKSKPVIMGSYGISPGRSMGTVVELNSDNKGIIWPKTIAPYHIHLVTIADSDTDESFVRSKKLYDSLIKRGEEVLWDDRLGVSAGSKFSDSDLMGIPTRLVLGKKSIQENAVESIDRRSGEVKMVSLEDYE